MNLFSASFVLRNLNKIHISKPNRPGYEKINQRNSKRMHANSEGGDQVE